MSTRAPDEHVNQDPVPVSQRGAVVYECQTCGSRRKWIDNDDPVRHLYCHQCQAPRKHKRLESV